MFFRAVAVVALALVPSFAWAQEDARKHRFSAGIASISYMSFFRSSPSQLAAEVGWAMAPRFLPRGVELGAGLRATRGRPGVVLPLEVFGAARLVAQIGPWRPSVGPELGVSGLVPLPPRADRFPEDTDQVESRRLSPLFLSVEAAPLRFQFGRWTVSALELSLGAPLFPSGTALRRDLGLLSAGVSL